MPSDGWLRRRAHVAAQIEQAALDLCTDRPPDDVTVDEIAQAAGISRRTFFRYFRTRGDVFGALPLRHTEYLCAQAARRPAHETVMQAFIAAADEGGDEFEDDLLRQWAETVVPSLPIDGWSINAIEDAYAAVVAQREQLPSDDPRVRIWADALASVSRLAFESWMVQGGSRTKILAESWKVLAQLQGPGTHLKVTLPRGGSAG
ncbi:MAG: TetR family transcriptional regulator [Acidimicrobiia bacterium]